MGFKASHIKIWNLNVKVSQLRMVKMCGFSFTFKFKVSLQFVYEKLLNFVIIVMLLSFLIISI